MAERQVSTWPQKQEVMAEPRLIAFPYPVRFFSIVALCLLGLIASAQINEDFSDADLSTNPAWTGNLNHFEVNAYHQLHLTATGADSSFLSTPITFSTAMEWMFWVRLSFAPSNNNYARIYLMADNANPALSGKAFYIQLGEARSADAITLFYKDGVSTHQICRGSAGLVSNAFSIRIRVVCSGNGQWKIAVDPRGGYLFANEAAGVGALPAAKGFFALFCKYTASNSSGFYFDEIQVHPHPEDTFPPQLLQALVTTDHQILMNFNEPIDILLSLLLTNFNLSDGTHPVNVYADPLTGSTLRLDFSKPFACDQSFRLLFTGITDLDGNSTGQKEIPLLYHPPRAFDVLISEIMSDPVPVKGLPGCEYLEIYNRTLFPIGFNNWSLQTGEDVELLPDSIIAPHAFFIITAASNAAEMKKYGKIIALKKLSLANEGCLIALKDQSRQVIHALDFLPSWHDDAAKKAGGWSVEMIDPMNPCGESANYRSSIDPKGGTPGSKNSVEALLPDLQAPQLLSLFPADSLHVRLDFSETLDSTQLSDPTAYFIEPWIGQPKYVILNGPLYHSVMLELKHPLLDKKIYSLTVDATLNDCASNSLKIPYRVQFGLAHPVKDKCMVINEIMYDPGPGKQEFIELYNRSAEYYDLSLLYIDIENNTSATRKTMLPLCKTGQLVSPGEYIVLVSNRKEFIKAYPLAALNGIIEVAGLPALSNEGGAVTLSDSLGIRIDRAVFDPGFHFQMLRSSAGVSLERIDPEGASLSRDNWHSAAETSGFSTPGKINSQHASQNPSLVTFSLEPDQFTPDSDGKDDALLIHYNPGKPGSMLSIFIYDITGNLIRRLVTNAMPATENIFSWDGTSDNHTKAKPGIYVVFAEIYTAMGEVKHLKKTTILAPGIKR